MLVAVADSRGAIYNPEGLELERLLALKERGESVTACSGCRVLERDAVVGLPCDIWIPAARPDVVHEGNVTQLDTRLVVQGANIPFTPGAERYLAEQGVLCVPDFIANAGGVICAAMEYRGATESQVMQTIEEKLRRNTRLVLEDARRRNILPRRAAVELAEARVRKAMAGKRWGIF